MIPSAFAYVQARDLTDALRLLGDLGEDAKLLAGGQSLIPLMKLRFAAPATVIDIGGIAGLAGIERAAGLVTLGALTTHARIAADPALANAAPVLSDAARELGDPQVRNRGTIGGSCAHNDPAADYPAVMLALDATLTLAGAHGTRRVRASDFFGSMYETSIGPGEVLTHVAFADAPSSAYVKFHHPASGYAVVGAAVVVRLDAGRIVDARVALTGVAYGAFRTPVVEDALRGCRVTDHARVEAACRGVAAGIELRADAFASADYRAALADVITARAVSRALARSLAV